MLAEVGYRCNGLTYHATYNILYGECATGETIECEGRKTSVTMAFFFARVYLTYMGLPRNA